MDASKQLFNHDIVGDFSPCGTVAFMIIAHRRLSTLTQYLTWFGKSPTSTGEIDIIRDRERIQHTKEDHIHSTPVSHFYIGQQLHTAAGLLVAALLFLSLFFSLLFLLFLTFSHFVLHSWCLFICFNDSSSCSFVNNGGCQTYQTYQTLTLVNGWWLPPTSHHCSLLL